MKHMRTLWVSLLAALLICLPVCAQAEAVISQEEMLAAEETPVEVIEAAAEETPVEVIEPAAEEEEADEPPVKAEPLEADVPEEGALSLDAADDPSIEADGLSIEETDWVEETEDTALDDPLATAEGTVDWISSDAMNASSSDFVIDEYGILTKYNGVSSKISIPESVKGIGDKAFYNNVFISIVTIPETVVSIGNNAFKNCTSLKSVTIPDSVAEIGESAFYGCTKLSEIRLPKGLTEIPKNMLYRCSAIAEITLPENVTSIGESAFYKCSKITEIDWPEHLAEIGVSAFSSCGFTEITLPNELKSIGSHAFSYMETLKDVTLPESIVNIGSSAFYHYKGIVKIHVVCNSYAHIWARDNISSYNLDVAGHDFQPIAAVAATCTSDGQTGGTQCVKCGDIQEKPTVIKATGHKRVTVKGRAATCTENGLTSGEVCSVCGKVLSSQSTLSKLGHIVKKQSAVKETYFTSGLTEGSYCTRCGEVFAAQQVIPAQGPSLECHVSANASYNVVVGQQFQIVLDGGLVAKSFKSSKKKVVKVTGSGLVTACKRGSAKVTIKLTDGRKLTLKVKVGRNKVSGIYSKPTLNAVDYGQNIYLNSLEIVSPGKVVAEYWLVFKRLSSLTTTKFSYVSDTIYSEKSQVPIVNGTVRNVKIKTRGMHVKSFKVTYKGSSVVNTNVNLALLQATEGIEDLNDFYLNWLY